ncbi:hypothetical protein ABZ654_13590 [Streptomyces hygroscopicus]|uniref:Uncharacterized protein n=1 Tax=Streptomyces hygroscopicus TaxID=1912 RepID=A0ABQ3TQM7_STRHY|nr:MULTISPECIES: hypothetical protein [Streptomyces]GHJ25639.1 hypothetical protein TPA0910_00720 [Streptomyces hygroscopicus]
MTGQELADVRGALSRLRDCVESLRLADSESPHVRRLVHDVDRVRLDLDAMAGPGVAALTRGTARGLAHDIVVHIADGHMAGHDADDDGG